MLPNISTVLLSQKLFSQKRLISQGTNLLKYLDFKLHLNSKISVLHRFCSWASSSKCAQTGGRLKELGFKLASFYFQYGKVRLYSCIITAVVSEVAKI